MVKLLMGKSPLRSFNYSNSKVYCVFINWNLYCKYEMWRFFVMEKRHFAAGRKRKTEKWWVGGRCLPLFMLLNFLHWSLAIRLRVFVKVLQVVLNLTQALTFQVFYFCFIRSNFLLQRRLNIKSELWEVSCWWVWAQGFFLAPVVTDLQITFDLQRVVYNLHFLFLPTGLTSAFFNSQSFSAKIYSSFAMGRHCKVKAAVNIWLSSCTFIP